MNPRRSRFLILGLSYTFAAYHAVLALYSLGFPYARDRGPVIVAIVLYAAAVVVVLHGAGRRRLPTWAAVFALAVAISLPILVDSVLDPAHQNGYGTWYVAAVGTLLTICAARWRPGFAWVGIVYLVAQTVYWAGPLALGSLGVIGSVVWVGVAHIITTTLTNAARDSQRFAIAEREAAEWHAAQEAHLSERQYRLAQTGLMALPMLQRIRASEGALSETERRECLFLEGAIRDEIRGRRLLDDAVREQVMLARRRGVGVTLLDEGGIDDLEPSDTARVHARIAEAIRGVRGDKVIVRTVPEGSDVAVTVVGLSSSDAAASALGADSDDEVVDLWLEIPRVEPGTGSA